MQFHQPSLESQRPRVWQPRELVLRGLRPERAGLPVDWSSWYLTDEEDMGESAEQGEIIRTMLSALGQLARERGWTRTYWSEDQYFAWVPSEPLVRVSPDLYVIDDPPPPPLPDSWQTWLPGHRPPRFAVEVVSRDRKKDYEDAPLKYAQLGVRELVIFDPGTLPEPEQVQRVSFQLYQRNAAGAFLRVYAGPGPVYSVEIDAYLIARKEGSVVRLRLARDAAGRDIVPTAEERAVAEEAARRRAEEAHREAERRAAAEAEARGKAEEAYREVERRAEAEAEARRRAEEAHRGAERRAEAEAEARGKAEEAYREVERRAEAEAEARGKAEARMRELEEMLKKLQR